MNKIRNEISLISYVNDEKSINSIEIVDNAGFEDIANNNKRQTIRNIGRIFKLFITRILLIIISGFEIGFGICLNSKNWLYLIFLIPIMVIVGETFFICIKRNGRDFKWFSFSALAYTLIMLTLIYLRTSKKFYMDHHLECYNETTNEIERAIFKKCFGVYFE